MEAIVRNTIITEHVCHSCSTCRRAGNYCTTCTALKDEEPRKLSQPCADFLPQYAIAPDGGRVGM